MVRAQHFRRGYRGGLCFVHTLDGAALPDGTAPHQELTALYESEY